MVSREAAEETDLLSLSSAPHAFHVQCTFSGLVQDARCPTELRTCGRPCKTRWIAGVTATRKPRGLELTLGMGKASKFRFD
jgi:hypothetical protein